jgi:CubicO group peptidase (beta-lactamase class C family)
MQPFGWVQLKVLGTPENEMNVEHMRTTFPAGCKGINLLLLLLISSCGMAMDLPCSKQIDSIFSDLKSEDAPGAAVLVIQDGRIVVERGYGVTDLRTLHKIGPHTNFRLASVTKQFTAMAVMLLVHDGKLHYEDWLADFFPEFPEFGKLITIRHLLTHTSGLPDYEDLWSAQYPDVPEQQIPQITDAGVLKILSQQRTTKFPPGAKWDYSNSGYALLAVIVEKLSKQPFAQFLHDRIFEPLGMSHTIAYEKGKSEVPSRAYGHTRQRDTWQETDQSPTSAVLGDGGIYSSIRDLAQWDRALRHQTLLSEEDMRPALRSVQLSEGMLHGSAGMPVAYGFGWYLDPYKGHARMYHNGETIGFRSTIQRFLNDKLTIIVLSNRADINPESLALNVADLCFTLSRVRATCK